MATIADILDTSTARYPDKIAIRYREKTFSYSQLKDRVARLASVLRAHGIQPHDHVALISPNSNVNLELLFATAWVGAVLEQCNTRLSKTVMGELLGKSEAKIVFVSRKIFKSSDELFEVAHRDFDVVYVDGEEAAEAELYEDLISAAEPLEERPEVDESSAAMLLYTSGTTSTPKGVLLSHAAILYQMKRDIRISGLTQESVQLCVLPLCHVTFLSALEALSVGAELVILDMCKGSDMAHAVSEYGLTHLSLVPYLLKALTAHMEETGEVVDTLRHILYGAEPISPELLRRAQGVLHCEFAQGYGMTETAAAITMLLPEDHEEGAHLDTAGKPLPGVEIKIIEDGVVRAPLQSGEVVAKTEALMMGYYQNPEKTNEVIKDGWYFTGDIGYLDEEGYLHLIARKDDMIISGGENIYPQEINACVKEMDGVAEVASAGIPDENWGEALAVLVVPKEGFSLTEGDIKEFCATRLGHFKRPKHVFFVDAIERNSSGKISRKELKKRVYELIEEKEGMA